MTTDASNDWDDFFMQESAFDATFNSDRGILHRNSEMSGESLVRAGSDLKTRHNQVYS